MSMTGEIDQGTMLGQQAIPIRHPNPERLVRPGPAESQGQAFSDGYDTRESLTKRLGVLGGELIVETLKKLGNGHIKEIPQPEKSPTPYTRRLTKDSGRIDWTKSPEDVERFIRSVTPWPGARSAARWQLADGKWQMAELTILKAHLRRSSLHPYPFTLIPSLIQLPGKNPTTWKQFLAGHPHATFEQPHDVPIGS
jgi:methionyl-tRNA formyltransferase